MHHFCDFPFIILSGGSVAPYKCRTLDSLHQSQNHLQLWTNKVIKFDNLRMKFFIEIQNQPSLDRLCAICDPHVTCIT